MDSYNKKVRVDFEDLNDASVILLNEDFQPIESLYFDGFNYIIVASDHDIYKVIISDYVDEEGRIRSELFKEWRSFEGRVKRIGETEFYEPTE